MGAHIVAACSLTKTCWKSNCLFNHKSTLIPGFDRSHRNGDVLPVQHNHINHINDIFLHSSILFFVSQYSFILLHSFTINLYQCTLQKHFSGVLDVYYVHILYLFIFCCLVSYLYYIVYLILTWCCNKGIFLVWDQLSLIISCLYPDVCII